MGFEVEVKYRGVDHADLRRRLLDLGATEQAAVDHEDVYLAHPARDFAETGEALRLRGEGLDNRMTYKGSKLGGPAKTREEIEVAFAAGPGNRSEMALLFERLGFRPVAMVRKRRTTFGLDFEGRPMTVTLDEADGQGQFAEVEALSASDSDLAGARQAVLGLAGALGLFEVEPRSYLRMVLEAEGGLPRNPAGPT